MPAPKTPIRRDDTHAWLITGPLLILGCLISLPALLSEHSVPLTHNIQYAPVLLLFAIVATHMQLRLDVRRQVLAIGMNDVPILLALFYLPPALVIIIRIIAGLAWYVFKLKLGPHKVAFNAASFFAGTATATFVVATLHLGPAGDPRTWLVLALAIVVSNIVNLAAIAGVMVLVQGIAHLPQFLRTALPGFAVMGVGIVLGLVMLLTLQASPWASLFLFFIAVVLVLGNRAYARFLRQHKSLMEMYALTRDIASTNHDGTLPDVLLARVRALLVADSATLWLPRQGRHQELLLSARFDYPGLLDAAPTPDLFRDLAMRTGRTIAVGPTIGDSELRTALQEASVKDIIVVPLRSGGVTIGTLEAAGRLGERTAFGKDDVQLIETLAAHTGVAVENSRLVDRLQFDANHDALTGLANRRRMLEALGEAMSGRGAREVVAVLLFDVVALRQVNDSLGHSAGDKVLAEVARRLQALAPQGALVARVGDDEFAIELRTASAEAAANVADTLRQGLRDPMVIDSLTIDIDTYVGVSIFPEHGTDAEELLQRAHVATHVAKSRGIVQVFNAGLQSRAVRRVGLAADLRTALAGGELEVYFQPKVALSDRRLVGVECLARWEHPVHGQVAPPDFVAVAEHTGQLNRLNGVVLREGIRRARQWADAGRPLAVAVNLSARTLGDSDLPLQISELLDEHGVPADRLILEIAEDEGLLAGGRALSTLTRLRDLGVRLSVDDFGAGRSSFADLSRLPVQEVKIDRTFVQGMATSPSDLAIVRTIVDMARNFELDVVAEGVESELTLGLLEDMRCDMGQGFLFSRPLPYERFESWLQVQTAEDSAEAPAGEVRWLRAVP
ncbi:putative bifunctional diguanylate cyclase/phosphodiesterase [Dactylosporangium matsuzakiense]|uniref:Bifunctional diguanylate cyclase/phosphodiesterase n=1 Tax=Dactylosporangium matsuzakiense TaxID=53360 RepID=A0A9W6KG73_9ACTN|nr:bifunctional diguanylate cyclase/phosphodiesterase [Dactylosporangium matsuzakiense]UWZ44366.1 EAL domain-containing protein [Dactylosporangium matsuzakiense]GLK99479.1 bifunctional diguanylate cyclase/phosphodiesterase [Dactylosporangium matsuzakiense]